MIQQRYMDEWLCCFSTIDAFEAISFSQPEMNHSCLKYTFHTPYVMIWRYLSLFFLLNDLKHDLNKTILHMKLWLPWKNDYCSQNAAFFLKYLKFHILQNGLQTKQNFVFFLTVFKFFFVLNFHKISYFFTNTQIFKI